MDKIEVSNAILVSQEDLAAALSHMGFDSADDAHYWATDDNELNRLDALAQAFARHRLATRTDATPVVWMPIESAPRDWQDVLVYSPEHESFNSGGVFLAFCDPDEEIWYAHGPSGNIRLHPTHWQPTPAAPDHIEEPRAMVPATDVAALVEAAKASAEGWANAVEFNLLPVQHWQTANDLQRQLRQALAPFTEVKP